MRKGLIAWLLASLMALCALTGAAAEEPFTLAGFDNTTGRDWTTSQFFEQMEERTGIAFSLTQYSDAARWAEAKADMVTGNAMPDVLFKAELSVQETEKLYQAGKLIDLRPYLEEHAPNLWALLQEHPAWEKAITLPDGAIVALPMIDTMQSNNAMWINRTWLERLHLQMPTTAQELTEVLRAFRDNDPNRNGKQDEKPLSFIGMWDLRFLGHAFGIISNDYYVYADEGGTVREVLTSERQRAFLEWLHELWEENLIDHNGFQLGSQTRQITDSDATMTYGLMLAPTPLAVVPSGALDQYGMLMPLSFEGKQVYRDLCGDLVRGAFAVSAAGKNPAAMLEWVDFLYTEEGFRMAQAGLEGVDYSWYDNGTWGWEMDDQTVANSVMPRVNMTEGGFMPGLSSNEFQLAYDQQQAHEAIVALCDLKQYSVEPYPLVYLTEEEQARIDAIQLPLSSYAEKAMACFVTGDVALDDQTWKDFCEQVRALGLNEMLGIWQAALTR